MWEHLIFLLIVECFQPIKDIKHLLNILTNFLLNPVLFQMALIHEAISFLFLFFWYLAFCLTNIFSELE